VSTFQLFLTTQKLYLTALIECSKLKLDFGKTKLLPRKTTTEEGDNMNFLQGIKVIDLTAVIAGALPTMLLGDLGADVIKIEPPGGEHFRYAWDGAFFLAMNRNKRGIALDLRTKEGQEIVLKLVKTADVFIENFVPGTINKLGLGYDRVAQVNPRIIYCSVSGFGQEGPYSQRPAYDPLVQAMSGIMIATGEPDRPPVRQVTSLIDITSGLYAFCAILACLFDRERTGTGQRIDIALLDTAVSAMSYFLTHYSITGELPRRSGSGWPAFAPYQLFDTKDTPIWIGVSTDRFWVAFCQGLGLDELASDPRYSTAEGRREHRNELNRKVSDICKQYTSAELESKLVAANVPCGRLLNVAEASQGPQIQFRQLIEEWDYPGVGRLKTVRAPIMISGERPETKMQAPQLGEHTSQVLAELGYSKQEIQELIKRGIAGQYEPQA
jgi:crotonobetainyl-CoA:carnitine CoA-transferase CaiB-like acyl-CoA transferase